MSCSAQGYGGLINSVSKQQGHLRNNNQHSGDDGMTEMINLKLARCCGVTLDCFTSLLLPALCTQLPYLLFITNVIVTEIQNLSYKRVQARTAARMFHVRHMTRITCKTNSRLNTNNKSSTNMSVFVEGHAHSVAKESLILVF